MKHEIGVLHKSSSRNKGPIEFLRQPLKSPHVSCGYSLSSLMIGEGILLLSENNQTNKLYPWWGKNDRLREFFYMKNNHNKIKKKAFCCCCCFKCLFAFQEVLWAVRDGPPTFGVVQIKLCFPMSKVHLSLPYLLHLFL